MLHVTNGDVVARLVREAGLPGTIIPWQDVLHDGPVPARLSAEELRDVRARFLEERGWASYEAAYSLFAARDRAVTSVGESEEIVLWFECDLFDQLQLVQVIDRLGGRRASIADLGIPRKLDFLKVYSRFEQREPLEASQRDVGRQAWRAFVSPDPTTLEELSRLREQPLAHLGPALRRLLEEYPWTADGLSRSERNVLEAVREGARTVAEALEAQAEREEAPFLGDSAVASRIDALSRGAAPLLAVEERGVVLTPAGRSVLAGEADYAELNGLDRWVGGVHVRGTRPAWRWDAERGRLQAARD